MKKYLKISLVFALFCISYVGHEIHEHAHPVSRGIQYYVPMISGYMGMVIIPVLFWFRKTLHLAYILNGFTVIIGIIMMTHYSVAVRPIWHDNFFLIAKFIVGRTLFLIETGNMESPFKWHGWKSVRYPHTGFWLVHLFSLSIVYTLGNILWR